MTNLLRAEFRKLVTTRLLLGMTAGGLVLVAFYTVVIAFTAGTVSTGGAGGLASLSEPGSLRTVYGVPFEIGYIIPLIMGVMIVCGEFRHKTITPTYLATPRRSLVLAAKVVTAGAVGLGMGLLFTIESTAVGAAVVAGRGYPTRLTTEGVPRLLVLMVAGLGVWAVFGLGFGALFKNQVAAVVTALGIVAVIEGLLSLFLRWIHLGSVAKFLPASAANAIVRPSTVKSIDLLPWWAGALVLLAWGLLTALLGSTLTLHRDVT